MNRGGIDADFICAGIQHGANILQRANATAHCQRNKHLAGNLLHGVHCRVALFVARRNIQKCDFVGALFVIAPRNFHRVTGVTNTHKVDALHHPSLINVEARDNAFSECHQSLSRKASTMV